VKNMKDIDIRSEQLTFEEAIGELESIVAALEEGDVPLEKALELFKRGMDMADLCSKKLIEAQGIIKQLTRSSSGELEEVTFDTEDKELL